MTDPRFTDPETLQAEPDTRARAHWWAGFITGFMSAACLAAGAVGVWRAVQ